MKKNVGDTFTIIREEHAGTAYCYYLAKLDGGLALVDTGVKRPESQTIHPGSAITRYFTFICHSPGNASFQLACFRIFDTSDALFEEVSRIEIPPPGTGENALPVSGGWSPWGALTDQDKKVFDEAMSGFVGVSYTPVSASTQIVAGTNYRFLCDARITYPGAEPYKAIVEIYQPLQGKAVITHITRAP